MMTTGRDNFVEVNGLRIHYLEYGDPARPPLLLLHGVASLAHIWDYVAPQLATRYHVLSIDWRGHGDSDWSPDSRYDYGAYASDLDGMISRLGLNQPVLLGHSLGGYVALYYASKHQQIVRCIVAADVRTSITADEVEQLRAMSIRPHKESDSCDEAIRRWTASIGATRAPNTVLQSIAEHAIREASPGKWTMKFDRRALAISIVDPWPFLPHVKVPVLIMRGEESTIMSHAGARDMARLIPKGQMRELSGAGHHLFLDAPEEFIHAVEMFLDDYQ